MAWTTIRYNTTNAAAEINDNFTHIRIGDVLPLSGSSMVPTDKTVDMGSDTYKWNQLHIQNLDIATGGRVENTWNLIAEVTLSTTCTTIEFTGLNGDTDGIYHIILKFIAANTNSVYAAFNGISGTSYAYQSLYAIDAAVSAERAGSRNALYLFDYTIRGTTTANINFMDMYIYPKTGNTRLLLHSNMECGSGNYIYTYFAKGQAFNNTTDTITSFKIVGAANQIRTGTTAQIWALSMNTAGSSSIV